jgi:hypothetical protein
VPYALTVSIFGGTAPAIALYFKQQGHEQWFYYYLAGVIFLSLLVYATMRDTKHKSAMHRHDEGAGSLGQAVMVGRPKVVPGSIVEHCRAL